MLTVRFDDQTYRIEFRFGKSVGFVERAAEISERFLTDIVILQTLQGMFSAHGNAKLIHIGIHVFGISGYDVEAHLLREIIGSFFQFVRILAADGKSIYIL